LLWANPANMIKINVNIPEEAFSSHAVEVRIDE